MKRGIWVGEEGEEKWGELNWLWGDVYVICCNEWEDLRNEVEGSG